MSGRLVRTPALAEAALKAGQADFIALGRPLLADPDWPAKAEAGRAEEIRLCIACNQGCIDRLFHQHDVACTVNAECGHEREFALRPGKSQRIVVVGAGPAGMQAAITAAERGHTVQLFESAARPGGQLPAAAAAPPRPRWRELDEWLQQRLAVLGVVPACNTDATVDAVRAENPDAIILATGASPHRGGLPGAHRHMVQARDLLDGRVQATGAVVVAGGGCSGAQTAEYLAARGHAVSLVEKTADIAADAPLSDQFLLISRLKGHGVRVRTHTRIVGLESDSVLVESPAGLVEKIPADTVVICLGAIACDELRDILVALGVPVAVVGDALAPRKVTEAIAEGAQAVLTIERRLESNRLQ